MTADYDRTLDEPDPRICQHGREFPCSQCTMERLDEVEERRREEHHEL